MKNTLIILLVGNDKGKVKRKQQKRLEVGFIHSPFTCAFSALCANLCQPRTSENTVYFHAMHDHRKEQYQTEKPMIFHLNCEKSEKCPSGKASEEAIFNLSLNRGMYLLCAQIYNRSHHCPKSLSGIIIHMVQL